MQAAEGHDFVVFRFALLGELRVDRFPLIGGNLKNFPFVLKQNHGHGGLRGLVSSAVGRNHSGRGGVRHGHFIFEEIIAGHLLGIAAEKDVCTAASHVRGYGDRPFATGLGYDARFALMLLGVQDFVRNFRSFQKCGDSFGLFDGDRAYEDGLAALVKMADAVGEGIVFLHDAVDDGVEFFFFCAVDNVGIFLANQRAIRRDHHHVEVVNFAELGGFRLRRPGHAGEFFVHAEIILKGDGGEGLIFSLDLDAFLGFDGLVQTIRPSAAGHLAASEFVDDDDFPVFDDVIDVILVERVCAQGLVDVVN